MSTESPLPLEKVHRFLDEAGDTTFFGRGNVPALGQTGVSLCFSLGMVHFTAPVAEVRREIETLCRAVETALSANESPSWWICTMKKSTRVAEIITRPRVR